MRIFIGALLMAALVGCNTKDDPDPAQAEKPKDQQKARTPGGGLPGLFLPIEEDQTRAGNNNQQKPQQQAPIVKTKTIPKEEAKIVRWPDYKNEHPETVVVDGKVEGWDPFSIAGSAYVSMTNKINAMQFESEIKILKAEQGRPPTYDEFLERVKKYNLKFHDQHPYRLFGYNEKEGTMVMLEDKEIKREIYKKKGIPLDE